MPFSTETKPMFSLRWSNATVLTRQSGWEFYTPTRAPFFSLVSSWPGRPAKSKSPHWMTRATSACRSTTWSSWVWLVFQFPWWSKIRRMLHSPWQLCLSSFAPLLRCVWFSYLRYEWSLSWLDGRSVECGVWSVECGVWSVECGDWDRDEEGGGGVWGVRCMVLQQTL